MKRFILFTVALFSAALLCGQSLSRAEELFNAGDYKGAYSEYVGLLAAKPKDALLQYKAARTLFELGRYDEALPYFRFAASKKVYGAYCYIGDCCFRLYLFDDAVDAYGTCMARRGDAMDSVAAGKVNAAIAKARLGAQMMGRVEDIAVIDSVKTGKREFLSAYGLNRDFGTVRYTRDIFKDESSGEAVAFLSGREDRMVFASEEDSVLNLKISYLLIDGWSKPVLFSKELTTGMNENYPFVMADGVTVYFASKGFNSLGGYDIFMSRYNSATDGYTLPQNIGMPFNSPANDYMMVVDEQNSVGWFATDRGQNVDSVVVYRFVPNAERTLIETDDSACLREAARLRVYRKADAATGYVPEKKAGDVRTEKGAERVAGFVINDDVVYYDADDFISPEARKAYVEMKGKEAGRDAARKALEGKRRDYDFAASDDVAAKLRDEIIELEAALNSLQGDLKALVYKVRLEELRALERE